MVVAKTRDSETNKTGVETDDIDRSAEVNSSSELDAWCASTPKACPEPCPRIANFNLTQPAQLRVDLPNLT
jgi:hypothetical protein